MKCLKVHKVHLYRNSMMNIRIVVGSPNCGDWPGPILVSKAFYNCHQPSKCWYTSWYLSTRTTKHAAFEFSTDKKNCFSLWRKQNFAINESNEPIETTPFYAVRLSNVWLDIPGINMLIHRGYMICRLLRGSIFKSECTRWS